MSEHIQAAIVSLEQEIEALDQRRGDLQRAVDAMRPLVNGDGAPRKSKQASKQARQSARQRDDARRPP